MIQKINKYFKHIGLKLEKVFELGFRIWFISKLQLKQYSYLVNKYHPTVKRGIRFCLQTIVYYLDRCVLVENVKSKLKLRKSPPVFFSQCPRCARNILVVNS